jgi:DNA-binding MarR family transcriptional regulator
MQHDSIGTGDKVKFSEGERADQVFVLASELVYFAQKSVTKEADLCLAEYGYGRAHYRAMHMIRHHHAATTSDLLKLLKIKAASLNRVMRELIRDGHVVQENNSDDRRVRHHYLTVKGSELQQRVFDLQKRVFAHVFEESGRASVQEFLKVLYLLVPEEEREFLSGNLSF